MSTRIYVYEETDQRIEELAELFKISKAQIVEIAVNDYYRKIEMRKRIVDALKEEFER